MIKRRFYKHEHGDRDAPSDSSSSSSGSELEAVATDDDDTDEDDVVAEMRQKDSSGYKSEESSGNEVDLDPSGLPTNDDDTGTENDRQNNWETCSSGKCNNETVEMQSNTLAEVDGISSNASSYVLRFKSIFKCRICPRIVCLTEETLKAHLKSKRHARSEKLLHEGRLKLMLNNDGEIGGDIHPEKHSSPRANEQNSSDPRKKNNGRKRQAKRLKNKNIGENSILENERQPKKRSTKKRRQGDS